VTAESPGEFPRPGQSWQSKDKRDRGLTVYIESVADGFVTYKRFVRRRITVEGFMKLYRPFATRDA
jgi:hypothetical protein